MRAISLMLSHTDFKIKAIVTSEGSLTPEAGAQKVSSLLAGMGKTDIPVVSGNTINGIAPLWRSFNERIKWGRMTGGQIINSNPASYIANTINSGTSNVSIVCLGSLTNICNALKLDREIASKIDRIIWYNESVNPPSGFNYECDIESAAEVLRSQIRIDVVSAMNDDPIYFDRYMAQEAGKYSSQPAVAISFVHSQRAVIKKLKENHFRFADDLVALYLAEPELFYVNIIPENINIRYNSGYNSGALKAVMTDIIKGTYNYEHNVVFNGFPVNPALFAYDIRSIIDTAISKYGIEEWKANVMTDEFHGHLGVFSIVGAKMGIKARELFGVGPDMINVVSFTGLKPPYSCLTDGIQVSTGATLGMGTIRVEEDGNPRPSAVFTFNGRSFLISLKKEYLEKVNSDISEAMSKFGLSDHGYWELVRHNAIRYWLEWDRNKIFEITER